MTVADAASRSWLHQPHTLVFFVAALVCLAVAVALPLLVNRERSWERRVYWGGTTAAVLCAFFAAFPDWKLGVGMSLLGAWLMAFGAYFYTPYIKIRGKVYAFTIRDSRPDPPSDGGWRSHGAAPDSDATPDSYGGLATAKKSWWLLILIVTICAINVIGYFVDKQHPWRAALMASVIVAISTMFGYGDASWGYPVARRQRMQLFILSVITLGAFTALYLCAYCAGKRWPLSRKQSMEHRRPPRHQKQYP